MSVKTLKDLFVDELKDMYNAENQLTKALPQMAKKATSDSLKKAFENHLKETENQIKRLEKVFDEVGIAAKGKKCEAMEGLIKEAKGMMDEVEDEDVLDAALISAAQKVEHYEIGSYGTLRTFAKLLGFSKSVDLLQENLDEEAAADEKLTEIAESEVNAEAEAEG
ncbi:MAG: ferritin-like domain-containing protein [Ignavibacteriaceae bacterium]